MTETFQRQKLTVYEYASIDDVRSGDRCAVTFSDNKSFLPEDGGALSGEAVEYLSGGEFVGLVIEDDEIHWTSTDDSAIEFPSRFKPAERFLLERNLNGFASNLAELLDLTLIYEQTGLHDALDDLFPSVQSYLNTKQQLKSDLEENPDSPNNRVLADLERIKQAEVPLFEQETKDYHDHLCSLHERTIDLYDDFVEIYQSHEEDFLRLFEKFPAATLDEQKANSETYYRSLLDELLEKRTNHSPLSNFEPERAYEGLVPPAFDESDWEMMRTIALVKQIVENFLFRGVFLEKRFDELKRLTQESIVHDNKMYRRLTFPREESDYLLSHIVNVFVLSTFVAEHLDLKRTSEDSLTEASVFFDIGMLRVPPSAWMRSEEPSQDEITMIKEHSNYSVEWLKESFHTVSEETRGIIRRHHERLDGSGYPGKVEAEELTTAENILIVTDVYDAMSTTRPHRPAISPDKIITYFGNRENKFHGDVVSVLENYIGSYPPGTVVQLNSNEIGVAMAGGKDPENPKVKIVIDSQGDVYENPQITDLSASDDKRIVETVGTRNTPSALLKFIGD